MTQMDAGSSLRVALHSWAAQDPDRPALGSGPDHPMSRGALAGLLTGAEHQLRQLGLRPQDRVGVLMPQGLEGAIVTLQVACACSLHGPRSPVGETHRIHT